MIVDQTLNTDKQFEYKNNDLDTTFNFSNQIQERLDDVLSLMKEREKSINFMIEKPIEKIPNNPSSS